MSETPIITFHPDLMPARDDGGWAQHPHLVFVETPIDGAEDSDTYIDPHKVREAGFEFETVNLEDDVGDGHPTYIDYFDKGGTSIAVWEPTVPEGEGWWLVGLWDNEEGPVAMFVRRAAGQVLN